MRDSNIETEKAWPKGSLRVPNEWVLHLLRLTLLHGTVLCFLTGCEDLGVRNLLAHDQVPQAAHDEPRLVASPTPENGHEAWPRLGDVPFKPKDFSPKPVYGHYMDELATDRADARAARKQVDNPSAAYSGDQPNQPVPPQFLHP